MTTEELKIERLKKLRIQITKDLELEGKLERGTAEYNFEFNYRIFNAQCSNIPLDHKE